MEKKNINKPQMSVYPASASSLKGNPALLYSGLKGNSSESLQIIKKIIQLAVLPSYLSDKNFSKILAKLVNGTEVIIKAVWSAGHSLRS